MIAVDAAGAEKPVKDAVNWGHLSPGSAGNLGETPAPAALLHAKDVLVQGLQKPVLTRQGWVCPRW